MENNKSIVKCPNCQAEFDISEERCPNCGFQNDFQAKRAFDNKMDVIYDEREHIMSWPKRVVNFFKKNIIITVIIIIALILLLVGIVFVTSSQKKRMGLKEERNAKALLEECIESKDYKKMSEELEKLDDSDTAVYAKYSEIRIIYRNYERFIESYEMIQNNEKVDKNSVYSMQSICRAYYNFMKNYDSLMNDSRHLGNEDNFEDIYSTCTQYMDDKVTYITKEKLYDMYISVKDSENVYDNIDKWCENYCSQVQ